MKTIGYIIVLSIIIPLGILGMLLLWYAAIYEFQDINVFVSKAGRTVYTPYLIITKERVGNIYSVGFEAGWFGKWHGVQWNFLNIKGRANKIPEQCPRCYSKHTTPIGTIGADYVACNICGHTWSYKALKKEVVL